MSTSRKYPRLDIRLSPDQLEWVESQALDAGVNRSKWAKNRILNGVVGDRQGQRPSTPPPPGPTSRSDRRGAGGDRGDRILQNLGAAITATLQAVPDTGGTYTPSNPLDRVREVAVLSSQLLHLINQLEPRNERDQELIRQVWAIAAELQRKCAVTGKAERRRSSR